MPMLARRQKPAAWRDRQPVRSMTSGAKTRPPSVTLSVTVNNKRTCSVYGVDGTRLKKIENLAANANCAALPAAAVATVYFGAVEVRNWQVPGQEVVLTYPSPAVKLTNGIASYLHRDYLGPNRAITDAAGARVESAVYKPFGEQTEFVTPGVTAPESKGWIGERYDADADLQYLNARYYDPVLGMFLQPDWFEVLKPGVGTNRFSYSFSDPVNKLDPLGNQNVSSHTTGMGLFERIFGGFLNPSSTERAEDNVREIGERALNAAEIATTPVPVLGAATSVLNGADPKVAIGAELLGPAGDAARLGGRLLDNAVGLVRSPVQAPADIARRRASEQLVCRGGTCTPDRFVAGATPNPDGSLPVGPLRGISVGTSPNASVADLSQYFMNNQVVVTTVERIEALGGRVVPSPTRNNPVHADVSGLTAQQLSDVFEVVPNPVPFADRLGP
jgi:RHS repeat-associated protein